MTFDLGHFHYVSHFHSPGHFHSGHFIPGHFHRESMWAVFRTVYMNWVQRSLRIAPSFEGEGSWEWQSHTFIVVHTATNSNCVNERRKKPQGHSGGLPSTLDGPWWAELHQGCSWTYCISIEEYPNSEGDYLEERRERRLISNLMKLHSWGMGHPYSS